MNVMAWLVPAIRAIESLDCAPEFGGAHKNPMFPHITPTRAMSPSRWCEHDCVDGRDEPGYDIV